MTANSSHNILSDIAIPPGETLAETIEAIGLTQAELAMRMGRPPQTINEIINGKKAITSETAIELERVLGTPAHVWINLEKEYQFTKARRADIERLKAKVDRLKVFPYRKMVELGWVRDVSDKVKRVEELLSFFGVTSFDELPRCWEVAYRRSYARKPSPEALAAWLRRGDIVGRQIEIEPFNGSKLRSALPALRSLTRRSARDFSSELRKICAACGVAVVFIPHLPKTHANGATRWLGSDRALVQLSVLRRYDDIFWFSFFHELGHILLHGKRKTFVELPDAHKTDEEKEADEFARDTLIPPSQFRLLASQTPFSKNKVIRLARDIGIAPSIVVGRLQHEGLVPPHHLNALKTKLEIK